MSVCEELCMQDPDFELDGILELMPRQDNRRLADFVFTIVSISTNSDALLWTDYLGTNPNYILHEYCIYKKLSLLFVIFIIINSACACNY